MTKTNKELMTQARQALAGNWTIAIFAILIINILSMALSFIPKIGSLISFLVSGPILLGIYLFSLKLIRKQDPAFNDIFNGFSHYYIALKTYLWMILYIFLWTLLLIIPGIIRAISYSMTFFILADNPTLGARVALKQSRVMMNGYKWKYVCLNLRFLGWAILSILTLGIGFLWLIPYIQVSLAAFYEDIKHNTEAKTATPEVASTEHVAVQSHATL
jgi:uncharacterized membrane protein